MTATQRKRQHTPHQPVGRWCRPDKRLAIYLRDCFHCLFCGRDLHGADPQELTLDHVVTKSNGGNNEPSNLFLACKSCNCRRQDKTLREFCQEFENPKEVLDRIRRHCRRRLERYRQLAKDILKGALTEI